MELKRAGEEVLSPLLEKTKHCHPAIYGRYLIALLPMLGFIPFLAFTLIIFIGYRQEIQGNCTVLSLQISCVNMTDGLEPYSKCTFTWSVDFDQKPNEMMQIIESVEENYYHHDTYDELLKEHPNGTTSTCFWNKYSQMGSPIGLDWNRSWPLFFLILNFCFCLLFAVPTVAAWVNAIGFHLYQRASCFEKYRKERAV